MVVVVPCFGYTPALCKIGVLDRLLLTARFLLLELGSLLATLTSELSRTSLCAHLLR